MLSLPHEIFRGHKKLQNASRLDLFSWPQVETKAGLSALATTLRSSDSSWKTHIPACHMHKAFISHKKLIETFLLLRQNIALAFKDSLPCMFAKQKKVSDVIPERMTSSVKRQFCLTLQNKQKCLPHFQW